MVGLPSLFPLHASGRSTREAPLVSVSSSDTAYVLASSVTEMIPIYAIFIKP